MRHRLITFLAQTGEELEYSTRILYRHELEWQSFYRSFNSLKLIANRLSSGIVRLR